VQLALGFSPLSEPKRRFSEADGGGEFLGFEFTNLELLEVSAVPIPANSEVLARLYSKLCRKRTSLGKGKEHSHQRGSGAR
jgi:hypothetical protein